MILVGQYDSPYVRRVAVTLHHYGMPFARNSISVFGNAKEMKAINPLVRIPSLVLESGEVMIDSAAIIDHLDEMAGPARALMPPHGPERRRILQSVVAATGAIDKAGAIVYERHFHPARMLSREWEQRCSAQLAGALEHLERACGAPWYIDAHMSQADVTVGCMLGYLKLRLPEAFPVNRFPKLHLLASHCEMREEFVRSRPNPDEVMPERA